MDLKAGQVASKGVTILQMRYDSSTPEELNVFCILNSSIFLLCTSHDVSHTKSRTFFFEAVFLESETAQHFRHQAEK